MRSIKSVVNNSFKYVVKTSKLYKIDESHALKHSMQVYGFAKKIYEHELPSNPHLEQQREIIYNAAICHNMCDTKYIDKTEGILRYQHYLSEMTPTNDVYIIGKIIDNLYYSKDNRDPGLGEYKLAYHIVREANLLARYDIDQYIIYNMYQHKLDYTNALRISLLLFDTQIFTMRQQNLFKTDYSERESLKLHKKAQIYVDELRERV
jgi:hypothetical protein